RLLRLRFLRNLRSALRIALMLLAEPSMNWTDLAANALRAGLSGQPQMHRIEVDEETARLIESQGDLLPIEDGFIEVDDEVFAWIIRNALPGEDTAAALRRILREKLTN